MRCWKCESEVSSGISFCPHCGSNLGEQDGLRDGCVMDAEECVKGMASSGSSRDYIRRHFNERLEQWKQASEGGVREAQWLLGRCFDEGFGVERNAVHSMSWHLRSAEQGYCLAQYRVGCCYQDGNFVPQDVAEAVRWIRRAAEQGYVPAQANLGWCYDTGTGVDAEDSEAVKWYRKAGEQGDVTSQFNLGLHYESGLGVEKDISEASKWYRKAFEQGYKEAKESLDRLSEEQAEQVKVREEEAEELRKKLRCKFRDALSDGKVSLEEMHEVKEFAEAGGIAKEEMKQILVEEREGYLRNRQADDIAANERKFRIACKNAYADGVVTEEEKGHLRGLAKKYGLSKEMMKQVFREERQQYQKSQFRQPSKEVELQFRRACQRALSDGKLTADEKHELSEMAKFFKLRKEMAEHIFKQELTLYRRGLKDQGGGAD